MSHIFISYSKLNKDYTHLLKTKLLSEGFSVWMDDAIEPSEDWWRNIRQAIRECAAFALIMTPMPKGMSMKSGGQRTAGRRGKKRAGWNRASGRIKNGIRMITRWSVCHGMRWWPTAAG